MDQKMAEIALEKVAAAHGVEISFVVQEIECAIRSMQCQETAREYPTAVELVTYLAEKVREQGKS